MVCTGCGWSNRPGVQFCTGCGKPLAQRCPSCGRDNDPDDQFRGGELAAGEVFELDDLDRARARFETLGGEVSA